MKKFSFPKSKRIRRKRDFDRIYALRQRASDQFVLIYAGPNGLEQTRIGLSVSKKHGNAVQRTRLKRLLREAFRLSQHELPRGLDLILIPKKSEGATLCDYQRSLVDVATKLAQRISRKSDR